MLPQLVEDQSKFTARLEAVKRALRRNEGELKDLQVCANAFLV